MFVTILVLISYVVEAVGVVVFWVGIAMLIAALCSSNKD